MKYIIDLPEETAGEIALHSTFLNPRDKERLQIAFRKRQPLDGVLQEIRQEIADFEEEVFHEPDTDYKAYASVRYCCDIIDKHIKEIEGRDKE